MNKRPANTPEYRYRNALKWIQFTAGMHYFGGAFDPEHMRTLANVAADALAGVRDLPDFEESQETAKREAREMAERLGLDLIGDDEIGAETGGHGCH